MEIVKPHYRLYRPKSCSIVFKTKLMVDYETFKRRFFERKGTSQPDEPERLNPSHFEDFGFRLEKDAIGCHYLHPKHPINHPEIGIVSADIECNGVCIDIRGSSLCERGLSPIHAMYLFYHAIFGVPLYSVCLKFTPEKEEWAIINEYFRKSENIPLPQGFWRDDSFILGVKKEPRFIYPGPVYPIIFFQRGQDGLSQLKSVLSRMVKDGLSKDRKTKKSKISQEDIQKTGLEAFSSFLPPSISGLTDDQTKSIRKAMMEKANLEGLLDSEWADCVDEIVKTFNIILGTDGK